MIYLESARKQFKYYKMLGDKTIDRLTEEEILWQYNEESNSIAIIVNHLWGNMMSRWTNFLTEDGEKSWRNRDREFEDVIRTKAELEAKWEEGWGCLFDALDTLNEDKFNQLIYIRNQGHTIVEAINRQITHYAYHVGQMVFLAKIIKGSAWESLSIPRGQSTTYNKEKFAQPKHTAHFTDDEIKKHQS